MSAANDMFLSLFTSVSSLFIVFGGALPYIPQYLQIRKDESSEGFSTKVCFVLITANILRIAFWFGKFYETPLLVQSVLIIITMLVMLELCIKCKKDNTLTPDKLRSFTDFDAAYFWNWSTFLDYVQCIGAVSGLIALLTYMFVDSSVYVEAIGSLSLCTEATLALPQLFKNFDSRSTQGMSAQMVLMWFVGDSFKTIYFIVRDSPLQFLMCGSIQTFVDVLILFQVVSYDKTPERIK